MIGLLVHESYKAKKQRELLASVKTEHRPATAVAARDFSMYKTLVGD